MGIEEGLARGSVNLVMGVYSRALHRTNAARIGLGSRERRPVFDFMPHDAIFNELMRITRKRGGRISDEHR